MAKFKRMLHSKTCITCSKRFKTQRRKLEQCRVCNPSAHHYKTPAHLKPTVQNKESEKDARRVLRETVYTAAHFQHMDISKFATEFTKVMKNRATYVPSK